MRQRPLIDPKQAWRYDCQSGVVDRRRNLMALVYSHDGGSHRFYWECSALRGDFVALTPLWPAVFELAELAGEAISALCDMNHICDASDITTVRALKSLEALNDLRDILGPLMRRPEVEEALRP